MLNMLKGLQERLKRAIFAIEDMQGFLPFAVIKEETRAVLCLTL